MGANTGRLTSKFVFLRLANWAILANVPNSANLAILTIMVIEGILDNQLIFASLAILPILAVLAILAIMAILA